jgi:hypothetical protein
MRCLTCHGKGWIANNTETRAQLPTIPCPRCQGTGFDHCCDGADAFSEIDEQEFPTRSIKRTQEPILRR